MQERYSVSEKAFKHLNYKLIGAFISVILLGLAGGALIPHILFKIIFMMLLYIVTMVPLFKLHHRLHDVYRARHQYIEVKDGKIIFEIYDVAQNEALKYTREEPIIYRLTLSDIKKVRKGFFVYHIQADELKETVLRRHPFTVNQKNLKFIVYRIFEKDESLSKVLRGFKNGEKK